jgi:hypothetical protein
MKIGDLDTGRELSWDELQREAIARTRWATKRAVIDRTLPELVTDVRAFIEGHAAKGTAKDREAHNLQIQLDAAQEVIGRQNIEINTLKKSLADVNRTLQERTKGA